MILWEITSSSTNPSKEVHRYSSRLFLPCNHSQRCSMDSVSQRLGITIHITCEAVEIHANDCIVICLRWPFTFHGSITDSLVLQGLLWSLFGHVVCESLLLSQKDMMSWTSFCTFFPVHSSSIFQSRKMAKVVVSCCLKLNSFSNCEMVTWHCSHFDLIFERCSIHIQVGGQLRDEIVYVKHDLSYTWSNVVVEMSSYFVRELLLWILDSLFVEEKPIA